MFSHILNTTDVIVLRAPRTGSQTLASREFSHPPHPDSNGIGPSGRPLAPPHQNLFNKFQFIKKLSKFYKNSKRFLT